MKNSDKLKAIRKLNRLTQDQFAEKLRVSRATVINWEKGHTFLGDMELSGIVKMFDISEIKSKSQEIVEMKDDYIKMLQFKISVLEEKLEKYEKGT